MGIMKKLLVMGVSLFACAISVFSKENFKFVDISDIADTPFGASIEGEFAPFKKLSGDTAVNLGGIDFKLCRSEERRVGKECRSRWSPYH